MKQKLLYLVILAVFILSASLGFFPSKVSATTYFGDPLTPGETYYYQIETDYYPPGDGEPLGCTGADAMYEIWYCTTTPGTGIIVMGGWELGLVKILGPLAFLVIWGYVIYKVSKGSSGGGMEGYEG